MSKKDLIGLVGEYSNKPEVFAKSTAPFWDDEHISKNMLAAHLNPNWDAATRKIETVEKTVEYINGIASKLAGKKMLDLGCGPGIYAEKFTELGYDVTGVDISKRSIDYAIENAKKNNHDIKYILSDYTELKANEKYDVILMIYCDYGVLSPFDRNKVLKFVFDSLKDDGVFIFDVFTPLDKKDRKEESTYYVCVNGGFWSAKPHFVLENMYSYENNISLDQSIVIEDDDVNVYRIWDQQFTQDTIGDELKTAHLELISVTSDLTGKAYEATSNMMGLIAKKSKN